MNTAFIKSFQFLLISLLIYVICSLCPYSDRFLHFRFLYFFGGSITGSIRHSSFFFPFPSFSHSTSPSLPPLFFLLVSFRSTNEENPSEIPTRLARNTHGSAFSLSDTAKLFTVGSWTKYASGRNEDLTAYFSPPSVPLSSVGRASPETCHPVCLRLLSCHAFYGDPVITPVELDRG